METAEKLEILLVEDSPSDACLTRDILTSSDLAAVVTTVASLTEARRRLARTSADLLLVDLFLPDGRGTELLGGGDELAWPVVIMTGQGNEEQAVDAIKAGAVDYIVKSAQTLEQLPRIVEKALNTWQHVLMRRRAEEDLERRRRKYQDLVETINDWVWEVDAGGVYTYASPRIEDLLGYVPEEVLGKTPFDLMDGDEARRLRRFFVKIAQQRKPFRNIPNVNRHKEGHRVVLETSGIPFYGRDGSFCGYRGVDRDITDRKRAADRLKAVNRELASFAHTVSHDLRTPLTAIIGFSEFLREEYETALDRRGAEAVDRILNQSRRMLALMHDLLALARIGTLQRPAETVPVAAVVAEVASELQGRLATAGLELRVGSLPEARIPRHFLAEIFENLIGNALQYAGSGGGPIEVGGGKSGQRLRLFVRDHGAGIPADERRKVFQVFFRGSSGAGVEGTGVGLAIVGKIAQLYGGRAWVEETEGGGSTFFVEVAEETGEADAADRSGD